MTEICRLGGSHHSRGSSTYCGSRSIELITEVSRSVILCMMFGAYGFIENIDIVLATSKISHELSERHTKQHL